MEQLLEVSNGVIYEVNAIINSIQNLIDLGRPSHGIEPFFLVGSFNFRFFQTNSANKFQTFCKRFRPRFCLYRFYGLLIFNFSVLSVTE